MATHLTELFVTNRNLVVNDGSFSLGGGGCDSGRSLGAAKLFKLRSIS